MNEMQKVARKVRFQSPEQYDQECNADEMQRLQDEWPDNF